MHNLQFLPTEVQASILELRDSGVPAATLDLLVTRILRASEAKVTSLQLDLERIELSFERRYGLLETKLIADNQNRTSDIYQMVSDVRNAQLVAHPQISQLQTTLNSYREWGDRLEAAFIAGRDFAASERADLRTAIEEIDGRVAVIEEILELKPKANGG